MIDRDFEMMDLNDLKKDITKGTPRKYGDFITKEQYDSLKGDVDWFRVLNDGAGKADAVTYHIVKGAEINYHLINKFQKETGVDSIPVLREDGEKQYKNKLSNFSKQCAMLVTGTVFKCVRDWIKESEKELSLGVDEYLKKNRTELHSALLKTTDNLEHLVRGLTKQIAAIKPDITAIALYEELIGDVWKFEYKNGETKTYEDDMKHSIEVFILSSILAKRCNLDENRTLQLGTSAFLHDIGKIISFQKVKRAILTKEMSTWSYEEIIDRFSSLHPLYGAALLSREDGKTIEGLDMSIRHNVLTHHLFINGKGKSIFSEDYIKLLGMMGIRQDTKFYGFNHLPTDPIKEDNYPLIDGGGNKKRMTMNAQILSIIEYYVTNKKKLGGKDTIKKMMSYAGKRFNGPIFEKFFFTVVPETEIPDTLVGLETRLPKYKGAQVLIREVDKVKQFYIIKDKEHILVPLSKIQGSLKLGNY